MTIKITFEIETTADAIEVLTGALAGLKAPAKLAEAKAAVAAVPPAAKPAKAKKPAAEPAQTAAPAAPAAPAQTEATATSPSEQKAPQVSDQDLRGALVKLQSLKGKDAAIAILTKYAKPATIAGCPQENRATVIAECAKAAQ